MIRIASSLLLGMCVTASVLATDRIIVASVEVQATPEAVWDMWTTEEGLSFFAPAARIELRPGGMYEVYFLPDAPEGMRGSEGTTVLGLQENRMLTVTWALPPYMQEVRPHLTPLTIEIVPVDGGQPGLWSPIPAGAKAVNGMRPMPIFRTTGRKCLP